MRQFTQPARAAEPLVGDFLPRAQMDLGMLHVQWASELLGEEEPLLDQHLVADDVATIDLPDGDGVRIRQRSDGEPDQGRLAVVVGDGTETVLADLGRDRPEGMWTHHPAVALLAGEHLRTLG